MSRSINEVRLIGNTGDAPTVNHTSSGQAITRVSLATTRKFKDRDGNLVERTEWHRVVFFGKLAEIAEAYIHKGSKLYVAGELRYEKYTDKEGIERYSTDIVVSDLVLLDGQRRDDREDDRGGQHQQRGSRQGGNERSHGNGNGNRNSNRNSNRNNGERSGGQYERGNGRGQGQQEQRYAEHQFDNSGDIPF